MMNVTTEATGGAVLAELKAMQENYAKLEKQFQTQQQVVLQQQAMLTSPQYLQGQVEEPVDQRFQSDNPQDVMKAFTEKLLSEMDMRIQTSQETLMSRLGPVLKKATAVDGRDNPIWALQQKAQEIMDANPGLSSEVAMELAETRQAKESAHSEKLAAEASVLERDRLAVQASLGQRTGSSAAVPDSSRSQVGDIASMERTWTKFGMDDALMRHNNSADEWGEPVSRTVRVVPE